MFEFLELERREQKKASKRSNGDDKAEMEEWERGAKGCRNEVEDRRAEEREGCVKVLVLGMRD